MWIEIETSERSQSQLIRAFFLFTAYRRYIIISDISNYFKGTIYFIWVLYYKS